MLEMTADNPNTTFAKVRMPLMHSHILAIMYEIEINLFDPDLNIGAHRYMRYDFQIHLKMRRHNLMYHILVGIINLQQMGTVRWKIFKFKAHDFNTLFIYEHVMALSLSSPEYNDDCRKISE